MTRFRAVPLVFLTLALFVAFSAPVHATTNTALIPALPLSKPSLLTPIAAQLDQLLTGGNNAPAATTTGSTPLNVTTTTTEPVPGEEPVEAPGETFGTRALSLVLNFADVMASQTASFAENFADLPQASSWFEKQINDQRIRDRWNETGHGMVVIVAVAFGGAFLFQLLLLPIRRNLRHRAPKDLARRLSANLGLLLVELLPIIFFVAVSLTLLDVQEPSRLPRFVVLNVIYAIALNHLVLVLGAILLAPRAQGLRILPISQLQASFLYRWFRIFSFVAVYGYFIVDVARSVHVPEGAVKAFGDALALILVIMTIIIIGKKRSFVAVLLRGPLSAAQRDLTPFQSLRLWFARSWHVLAIAYLVIGYLITAFGVEGGMAILVRGTVLTFLVLVALGLSLHTINRRMFSVSESKKLQFHQSILRFFVLATVWLAAICLLSMAWGASVSVFLNTDLGKRVSGSLFSIGVTVVVLALIYGFVSSSIERHLNRSDKEGAPIPVSARMRTLLPMLRNAAFIIFTIIASMVILSEAGLNIGPLLAGAGVIGVAVGFGSQTLVKDFLTGLFIVIENTIAIGDVVRINTHAGTVEAMSVRTLRLRDSDGAVHILPYSEVTNLINLTKDFAYALFNTSVAYNSDLRKVMLVIKAVGDELRQDAKYKNSIIDPIEVLGVDNLADSAIIIQSRIRTRPGRQWDVKRAFLLRLKERFDAEKIVIPYPTVYQLTKDDTQSPAAPVAPPPPAKS